MKRTLTRHLLAWVSAALLVVWGTFVVLGYATGEHEADELTDGHLASVAALLLAVPGDLPSAGPLHAPVTPGDDLRAHDYQQSLSFAVWDADGRLLARLGDAPAPPADIANGFANLSLGRPPAQWRAFTRQDAVRGRKIAVLLSLRERDDLAQDIAGQVIEPSLWLLPVVLLVLGMAIVRGLKPLYAVSADVHALDVQNAQPLRTQAPHEELEEIVRAVNTLVERYRGALDRERALSDEFAHELRTPLASLLLQARALRELPPGAERDRVQARLETDARRAADTVSHLLALARAGRVALQELAQPVDLHALAADVLAQLAPRADAEGRPLALAGEAFTVNGHAGLLEIALRNLVDNALAHTPRGTLVEVRCDPVRRCLEVCDLPPAGGSDVAGAAADPLHLGLGHRVVRQIAAIHGARFETGGNAAMGRCFRLAFGPSPTIAP